MGECVIHWFRRDLRLSDNLALEAALRTGVPVIPVFVLDSRILGQPTMGEARLQFLRTALDDLDRRLVERGSRLVVLHGDDAARELNRLAEETGAWALHFNRDYTPFARWRDTRATRGMQMTGVVTMPMDDLLLVSPLRTLGERDHLPTTFPAFSRRWFAALDIAPGPGAVADGTFMAAAALPSGAPSWREMLAPGRGVPSPWPGATEAGAEARLREFVAGVLPDYVARREVPADPEGTSRLSAALKFGTVSVRKVAAAALEHGARNPRSQPAVEELINRLAWREFAHHLLFDRPELLGRQLREPVATGAVGDLVAGGLEAWMEGRVGVPLVDAGMRQLLREGWMPDLLRTICASFLVHQLGADWRAGKLHFARHLVDHDVAINELGWRWSTGVGLGVPAHARSLNPARRGEAHDPGGEYVRRYLPELERVPREYIHRPWKMPDAVQAAAGCRVGIDYPRPIAPVAMPRSR